MMNSAILTGIKLLTENDNKVKYTKPQFDVEWEETERYPFLYKLGQQGWEELAKTGKAITVTKNSVKKIGNTGADGSETLDDLEPDKVARLKKAMKSGTVEMPIVMKQPNGKLELIGGNTRLIGLINTVGKATVWYIDASKLEENFADGKKKEGVAEVKVKLYTDPDYFGAEVDYSGFDSLPVVNIPTDQLVGFEPDDKMNDPKSKANVKKIVTGLEKGNKLPPVLVRKYKNGYQVLDGHHRFWAYKLLKIKSIPVRIVPAKDIEKMPKQGVAELDEGMGASAGGGTAGSPGAGGSSLGLPYPSTYEEENDKFKRKGQERFVAMTTEQKIYKRDELPQLNSTHFENGDFEIEEGKIKLSKLIPIQTERVKGLVEKTIEMIEDGKDKPLIIDRKGRIVNGHHRYDAYTKLGYKKVPVLKVNATVEQLIDKYMKQD